MAVSRQDLQQFVELVYRGCFRRKPDPEGLKSAVNALENGLSPQKYLEIIVNSTEFQSSRLVSSSVKSDGSYDPSADLSLRKYSTPTIAGRSQHLRQSMPIARPEYDGSIEQALRMLAAALPAFGGQAGYLREHRDRFYELTNLVATLVAESRSLKPSVMDVGFSINTLSMQTLIPTAQFVVCDRPGMQFPDMLRQTAVTADLTATEIDQTDLGVHADVIVLAEVIEHLLANPVRVLSFLLRHLTSDGHLIVTTPNFFRRRVVEAFSRRDNPQPIYPRNYGPRDAPHFHVREYAMKELLGFVEEAGGAVDAYFFSSCWEDDAARKNTPEHEWSNMVVVARRRTSDQSVGLQPTETSSASRGATSQVSAGKVPGGDGMRSLLDQHRHLGILNRDPLIVLSCVDSFVPLEVNLADVISKHVSEPFSLVLEIWQSWEQLAEADPKFLSGLARSIQRHLDEYPQNQIWIACNTEAEVRIAESLGLRAAFLNHNAFINEHVFRPLPDIQKSFDAVYNAQMWTRKRHELAAQIGSICLVYAMHLGELARERLAEVKRFMPQALLANGDPLAPGGNYRYLSQAEVNVYYNRSRVGLCLSAYEGASLASAEYLLAGLPVVSTVSKGGRDVLFREPWCLTCGDTPEEVRDAVSVMVSRHIAPSLIRAETLSQINELRSRWINFVEASCERMGNSGKSTFRADFPRIRESWSGMPYKSVQALLGALAIGT